MTATAYLGTRLTNTTYRVSEIAELHRWEVTDGWGTDDDVLRLTFLQDTVPTANAIILVVDGRTFGPYDVETKEIIAGLDEVMAFGRADRYFEDTLFETIEAVYSQAVQRIQGDPYASWGISEAINNKLDIFLNSALRQGDIRRQLARYGLTVAPTRGALWRSATELHATRSVDVQVNYPTAETAPRVIHAGLVDHGARCKIADDDNFPGAYAQRPIIAGYRIPGTGLVEVVIDPPSADEHAGNRLKLDIQKTAEEPAGFVINAKRWELQNTAAMATVTLTTGDLSIKPQQLLDFTPYADSGLPIFSGTSETWRVTKVTHKGEGAAFETQLDLALWQGVPGSGGGGD